MARQQLGRGERRNRSSDTHHRLLHGTRQESASWSGHATRRFVTAVVEEDGPGRESLQRKASNLQQIGRASNHDTGAVQAERQHH